MSHRPSEKGVFMIRVAICDDELSVLNELSSIIDKYRIERNQEIVYAVFHSPLDLLTEFEKGMRLDILFLDILMPGEKGIDVAKEIREHDNNVKIIFLTSSPEYALQSYLVKAFFYQIKPVCEEEVFRLMDSAISECEKIEQKGLVIKCKHGITRIKLDKLMYCEVMGRTLLFHMEDGQIYERNGKLEELQEQLLPYDNFIRSHRSYLINMEYIQNINCKTIIMNDLAEIPIPHGKYSETKDCYLEYAFHRKQVFLS